MPFDAPDVVNERGQIRLGELEKAARQAAGYITYPAAGSSYQSELGMVWDPGSPAAATSATVPIVQVTAITAVSGSLITTSAPHGLSAGQSITLTNGTSSVSGTVATVPGSSQFTFSGSAPQANWILKLGSYYLASLVSWSDALAQWSTGAACLFLPANSETPTAIRYGACASQDTNAATGLTIYSEEFAEAGAADVWSGDNITFVSLASVNVAFGSPGGNAIRWGYAQSLSPQTYFNAATPTKILVPLDGIYAFTAALYMSVQISPTVPAGSDIVASLGTSDGVGSISLAAVSVPVVSAGRVPTIILPFMGPLYAGQQLTVNLASGGGGVVTLQGSSSQNFEQSPVFSRVSINRLTPFAKIACCNCSDAGGGGLNLPRQLHATVLSSCNPACPAGAVVTLNYSSAQRRWVNQPGPAGLFLGCSSGIVTLAMSWPSCGNLGVGFAACKCTSPLSLTINITNTQQDQGTNNFLACFCGNQFGSIAFSVTE